MTKKQRTRIIRITLAVVTVASLFTVPWIVVWAWILPLPHTIEEQLDEAVGHGFEGIIVYAQVADEPAQFYAAGWHNREEKIPATPHALFKIASISKLYHAVAVTKLVHSGQLSLDGTLAQYFPELTDRIENADKITLRMMVQHRSGIPNFTAVKDYWMTPPAGDDDKLALILDQPASFEPDTDYEYCNTNYLLLAMLMDKVLGYSRYQYMQEEVFNPLGLQNTFGSMQDIDMDRLMSGYYVGIEQDIKTDTIGSMIASAEDVGIFLRALNDGSLFTEGEEAIYNSLYTYEHTGLIPGYQSIARYHKDMDAVVVQFVNTTNFSGYTWDISEIVYGRVVKILRKNSYNKDQILE